MPSFSKAKVDSHAAWLLEEDGTHLRAERGGGGLGEAEPMAQDEVRLEEQDRDALEVDADQDMGVEDEFASSDEGPDEEAEPDELLDEADDDALNETPSHATSAGADRYEEALEQMRAARLSHLFWQYQWPGEPTKVYTAREYERCRVDRMSARPASLGDLPNELKALIVDHAPMPELARIALVNSHWWGLVAAAAVRPATWTRYAEEVRELQRNPAPRSSRSTGAPMLRHVARARLRKAPSQMLSAVACRLQAAHQLVTLLERVHAALRDGLPVCLSTEGTGALLASRPRDGWDAGLMMRCFALFHSAEELAEADEIDVALNVAYDLKAMMPGPRQGFHASADVLRGFKAALPMSALATFLIGWEGRFHPSDALDATDLGRLAAELALSGEQMATLVDALADDERERHEQGWSGSPSRTDEQLHFPETCTVLRVWARDARFPAAWSSAGRATVFNAVGAAPDLRRATVPLALGWVQELLEPLRLVADCPQLDDAGNLCTLFARGPEDESEDDE